MKRLVWSALWALSLVLAAALVGHAQISVPYSFTSGNTIVSAQVNSNFSQFSSQALNRTGGTMIGTLTSLSILPSITDTYNLGSASFVFNSAYIDHAVVTDGSGIAALSASNMSTGTMPDGRFPATLPAASGVNLTALNASNLASGTVPTARLPTFLHPTEFDNGNSGTTKTIDFSTNGPIQKVTRTGSCTFTLSAPASPGTLVLKFVHEASGTAYTVAYSPSVKFPNGTAPTYTNTTGATDILTLYYDGTNWYGNLLPAVS